MLKTFALTMALGVGTSLCCSFIGSRSMHYDSIQPGVVRVITSSPKFNIATKTYEQGFDTSFSRISNFKVRMDSIFAQNNIVFIGVIDSFIGEFERDTIIPGMVPDITLSSAGPGTQGFYARIKVDTVFKGALPSGRFWIRGATNSGAGCGAYFGSNMGARFFNFSDQLQTMQDLKLPQWLDNCWTCPPDGYFVSNNVLYSPEFPGLGLNLGEYLSGSITAIRHRVNPGSLVYPIGKAYRPDGRTFPVGAGSDRKSPVPLIR
jgi:hypothetical protein